MDRLSCAARRWCLLGLSALPLSLAFTAAQLDRLADFSHGVPPNWRSHSFAGETLYERVQVEDGRWALRATARDAASALGVRLSVKVAAQPVIRWRWKVDQLPAGADEARKRRDDAAARLLLVFHESVLPWRVKTICYLWASTLGSGQTSDSPYSSNVKIVAVESGRDALGIWKTEERDYAADYLRLFGEPADSLLGVSIMTDSDNTHSVAVAFYDYIELDRPRS